MQVMDALGDPVRRRLVELLSAGERSAGTLADAVGAEFGISQPATSRHLRVLREVGMVASAVDGQRRLYSLRREPLDEVEDWLAGVRAFWDQRLDALDTELRRGARSTQPAVSNDDPPHDLPHDQGNDEGARP
jgi:DNA-binding transcriptional ArsR family regulator